MKLFLDKGSKPNPISCTYHLRCLVERWKLWLYRIEGKLLTMFGDSLIVVWHWRTLSIGWMSNRGRYRGLDIRLAVGGANTKRRTLREQRALFAKVPLGPVTYARFIVDPPPPRS